jgi:hypothetical protein
MKLFDIIHFERCEENNILTAQLDNGNNCHIPLTDFTKWLKRTDRLGWSEDYSDYSGEHLQETGEYSLDQYWEMGTRFIHHDISDFIMIHFVNPFNEIPKSIHHIINHYEQEAAHLV